jgi:delta 1-pyrroline-5-carboxylate dehydrogenase
MGSMGPTFDIFSDFKNTINGKLTSTKETRHGINPATGKPNPEVPVSTQQDVDDAVAAGKAAFKKWSKVPYEERKKAVLAFADAIEKHQDDFGKLLTQEQGKPVCIVILDFRHSLTSTAAICSRRDWNWCHMAPRTLQA